MNNWFSQFDDKEKIWLDNLIRRICGQIPYSYQESAYRHIANFLCMNDLVFKPIECAPISPSIAPIFVPPEDLVKNCSLASLFI
jgi:hypothetical protein